MQLRLYARRSQAQITRNASHIRGVKAHLVDAGFSTRITNSMTFEIMDGVGFQISFKFISILQFSIALEFFVM